ncbi:NRPS-like protein biosynthetic cluster [Penicillium robsamsonii]|uniref:NRPS-like protein biosynthetic cluster n=1 Tax=Penicillium robsamsonii TaxID=1792511 RepID=UPI00254876E3|nr:NRPS-like protein biosynthetic cluster [Penicillium robsamsonii]KAJ5834116.1 NRPS-like protein biosynthetic cluster [Penicillium robsamsonii]
MSFPNEPFFQRLVEFANGPPRVIISDDISGIRITYRQLMSGVLRFRQLLQQRLPQAALDSSKMLREPIGIGILAPASVEFVVAFLAILSLGGMIVPLSTAEPAEATCGRIAKSNAACVVYSPQQAELMWFIRRRALLTNGREIQSIAISAHAGDISPSLLFATDQPTHFPSTRTALLLFTSGTMGPPKGVLHSRQFFNADVDPVGTEADALLFARAAGYIGAIRLMVNMLLRGIRIELWPYLVDADMIWERLRQGGITVLHLLPTIWRKLMLVYRDKLSMLPSIEREEYCAGARQLREATAGGQVMLQEVKMFWQDMLGGRCVTVIYGGTEMGISPFKALGEDTLVERTIGKPVPGIDFKLSEGNRGELLVKTPVLFTGYLDNPKSTCNAFDDEGFFRTGDIVRYNGSVYEIEVIPTFGGRVSAPKISKALLDLPEVAEGHIFAVPDPKYVNHIAALVRLQAGAIDSQERGTLSLAALRRDLAHSLTEHELPTLLRLVGVGEEVPHGVSGKLMYQKARERFFPPESVSLPEVEAWVMV